MHKKIAKIGATVISVAGLVLLIRVISRAVTGELVMDMFPKSEDTWLNTLCALYLSLPVPFHVISIGLILQKRWLSPAWARVAWVAIVFSGLWLGVAILIRLQIK